MNESSLLEKMCNEGENIVYNMVLARESGSDVAAYKFNRMI